MCVVCYSVDDDIRYLDVGAKEDPLLCDDLIRNERFDESIRRKSNEMESVNVDNCFDERK